MLISSWHPFVTISNSKFDIKDIKYIMNKKTKKVSEDSPIDVSYDSWENREMFLKVVFLIKKGVRRVDMFIFYQIILQAPFSDTLPLPRGYDAEYNLLPGTAELPFENI